MLFYQHRSLQSAADAAAYNAAITYSYNTNNTSAAITTQAKATVASYGFTLGTGTNQANVTATTTTVPLTAGGTLPAVRVTISRPQTAIFSSILFSVLHNSVSATAVISGGSAGGGGNCLLALGKTPTGNNAAPAIHVQGNATMDMGTCGVFSDSTAPCSDASVTIQGAGSLTAGSFGTAGCATGNGNHPPQIGPPPSGITENDGALTDPYLGVSLPTPATIPTYSCTPTASMNSHGKVTSDGTLCPGVYSQQLLIKGNTVTLEPGIYILQGGFQTGPGGGTVTTGTGGVGGVTLVFPSSSGGMDIDSNSNVSLTAPTSGTAGGPTAGFVLMGDYTMPLNTSFTVVANANADFNGTVYLPNGFMNWQGTADTTLGCRQFIVNTVSLQGNPELNSNGCGPNGGNGAGNPIGSIVTLVD